MIKMKNIFSFILVAILFSINSFGDIPPSKTIEVKSLVTEYKTNPIGIDVEKPRLNWKIVSIEKNIIQTAYQIQVAISKDDLKKGKKLLWDETKFYNQWETLLPDAFKGFNPNEGGYLQFEWSAKRIIKALEVYDTPYRVTAEMLNAGPSNNGGIVIRVPDISGHDEDPQEPSAGDPGYNRTGIALFPNGAGDGMFVKFSATPAPQFDEIETTRINVPFPAGQTNITTPDRIKFKLTIEDVGSTVYVFFNDEPFFKIDLNNLKAGVYSGGSVIAPFKLNITKAAKEGENTIEVEVVNVWRNRITGDKTLPESERTTWIVVDVVEPNEELISSGLLGPVTVQSQKIDI